MFAFENKYKWSCGSLKTNTFTMNFCGSQASSLDDQNTKKKSYFGYYMLLMKFANHGLVVVFFV